MDKGNEGKKISAREVASGFGILFRLLARYKREMFIFITLGIIAAIGNASIPYIVGTFIDALVSPTDTFQAWSFVAPLYLVVLGLWAFIKITLVYVEDHLGRHSDNQGMKIYTEYLTNSFSHVLRLPISFHKKHKMGSLFQQINMTADNIESIVANTIIQLGPQILSIFVAFAITFYINAILGGFLLGMVLVYLFIFIHGIEPLAKIQSEMYKAGAEVWGDVWDYMENTRQVKEAVAEERVANRLFYGFRNRIVRIWSRMHFASADLSLHQQLIILLSQFFIFVYSIYAIIGGTMTIGELLAVNGYAQMIFGPFVIIGRTWKNVQNGIININETEKLLAVPEEAYVPHNVVPLSEIRGDVSFTNVDFYYTKNTPVLKNISFEVKQGETVAIVGESGVGKTTLVDLLLGFYFPKKGTIKIDGVNIKRLDLKLLRGNTAVVSQDIVLFNDDIFYNVAFGNPKATKVAVTSAAKKADANSFIQKFPKKWKQMVGERGIKLSGGQRQRVALARAILANPKILILDEPTSALDARAEQRIQKSLAEIMKGKTTFIIAHRLSTVRNADKIIVLKGGGIVETGTHKQLIKRKKGEYRALYELQIGLHE